MLKSNSPIIILKFNTFSLSNCIKFSITLVISLLQTQKVFFRLTSNNFLQRVFFCNNQEYFDSKQFLTGDLFCHFYEPCHRKAIQSTLNRALPVHCHILSPSFRQDLHVVIGKNANIIMSNYHKIIMDFIRASI